MICRCCLLLVCLGCCAQGQQAAPPSSSTRPARAASAPARAGVTANELAAGRYLDSIRDQRAPLLEFVRELPKGGDLHNHLTGAVYAESYVGFAARDGLCVDRRTYVASAPDLVPPAGPDGKPAKPACDESKGRVPAARALGDAVFYRELIDAWSMRNFVPGNGANGHDHFFDTFLKFNRAKADHTSELIAEVASRAAHGHVAYLELMMNPAGGAAGRLGAGLGWNGDMAGLRQKLLEKQIEHVVADARIALDQTEAKMRNQLGCGTMNADPGCGVTIRYQWEVYRNQPRDQVFAEMIGGFEMATADPRIAGVNMVVPEDDYVSMRDFTVHMQMLDYLHQVYPKVRIALHAGELAPGLVPPEGLAFHIRQSVEIAHAERIGHGVDVMQERDAIGLLRELAQKQVLVEICLTSNDMILGIRGADHPLPMYLKYGVPVALATDDEGVARSDINQEYLRAITTYNLSYSTLKMMVRNSLEHSFVAGDSLWSDRVAFRRVAACQGDKAGSESVSQTCQQFLHSSQRAQLQWKLEGQLAQFEERFAQR